MPQRAAARREQPDPQLFVAGAAGAEDGDPGLRVGGDHAHLVRVPQGAAPHLIAAAIGQKLGRPVPLHEIGLADADPAPEVGLAFPRDVGQAVKSATELYRLDLAGRRAGSGGI
ncbi:hypothetical protein SGLAM104S_01050 [Streptomyces glaucescens]